MSVNLDHSKYSVGKVPSSMLQLSQKSSPSRRSEDQIKADRARLKAAMRSAAYRVLESSRERAHHLLLECQGHHPSDVASVANIPETNIRRWLKNPETRLSAGRPSYLADDDMQKLFSSIVPERYALHTPMTTREIMDAVSLRQFMNDILLFH